MKLMVIGVGNPIPTFISRRLKALALMEVELLVALGYGRQHDLPRSVRIVRYGDWDQMRATDFFLLALSLVRSPRNFTLIYRSFSGKPHLTRLKLALRYLPLALVPDVDLIHIQWIGSVPNLRWLKSVYRVPIISSVRGSQVTVYRYTQPGYAKLIGEALRYSDACHLVSSDLKSAVLSLGGEEQKLFVNYNGTNLSFFKPGHKEGDEYLRVISVGALIWRKGYVFQFLILQALLSTGVKATLTIIGDGVDRRGLLYTTKVLGLSDAVSFVGQLGEAEVAERLGDADVYLSTSLAEGLANSLVEAAACGLPIVAFDCEGVREVVEHEVTGFVVPPGRTGMAVEALQQLQDADFRSMMGQRARARAEEHFNQDKCVAEMISHYRRIVSAA